MPKRSYEHSNIETRIKEIVNFRNAHQKLREVVSKVFSEERNEGEIHALREINIAYTHFTTFDVLDISQEGSATWVQARKQYE